MNATGLLLLILFVLCVYHSLIKHTVSDCLHWWFVDEWLAKGLGYQNIPNHDNLSCCGLYYIKNCVAKHVRKK